MIATIAVIVEEKKFSDRRSSTPERKIKAHKDSSEVFARLLSEIYLRRENNSVHPPQGSVSHFQDLSYFEP